VYFKPNSSQTLDEILRDLWERVKAFFNRTKPGTQERAAAEQALDEVTELREKYEAAMAAAVAKVQKKAAGKDAGQASAGHGTIQYNLKNVHNKFQRNFTGEVEEGDGITLHYTEKSAIGHALKTGYGHLKYDGKKGHIYAGNYCYLFEVTQRWGVKVIDVIDPDALNIHRGETEGVFSYGRQGDNQGTAAKTEGRRNGQGDGVDNLLGGETSGRRRGDDGVDGRESGRHVDRPLRDVGLDSQINNAHGTYGATEGRQGRRTHEESKREYLSSPGYILAQKIESLEKARNKAKVGSDRRKELNRQLREAKAEFEKLTNGSRKRAQAQKNTAEGGVKVQHSLKGYNPVREKLAKLELDKLSDKLGEQFPLSARFGPYIKATQEVVSSPTVTAMSVPRGNRTYYGAAKDEFKKCYAKNEAVNMAGTGIIVKLQGDIARESMSKVLNRGGEQVLLDIIPYAKELIEGGKILGIERLQHTTNKLSGLFAYRVYNIFDYATTDPKTKKSQQRHTRLLQPLFKSTIVTVSFTLSVA